MKNPRLLTRDNVPCALSNLYYGNNCSVMAICDVVEDSETAEDLMNGLNKLNLLKKFSIDRVTKSYVRLKSIDRLGNVHYFKADF